MTEGIDHAAAHKVWTAAAKKLGWEHSPAHGGWIKDSHRKPGVPGYQWDSYPSDVDAEEACFIDGVETLTAAMAVVEKEDA
jgi:hypothetical protein